MTASDNDDCVGDGVPVSWADPGDWGDFGSNAAGRSFTVLRAAAAASDAQRAATHQLTDSRGQAAKILDSPSSLAAGTSLAGGVTAPAGAVSSLCSCVSVAGGSIFFDGFESSTTGSWSDTDP